MYGVPPPPAKLRPLWVCLCIGWLFLAPNVLAQFPLIPGDLNDDGFVGIEDINIVLGNWNQTVTPPGDLLQGDPSGDGYVGIEDLNVVLPNWNAGTQTLQPFKGMNLHQVAYWGREWVFVDVMKMCRPWLTSFDPAQNKVVSMDADGWPLQVPAGATEIITHVFNNVGGAYPGGDYVFTYEGVANVTFTGDVNSVTPDPVKPKTYIVSVTPGSQGIFIHLAGIDPNDHIRNIRFWMPGFDENSPSAFHPLYIKRLRPFKAIRFMDWQRTNTQDEVAWNTRATKTYFSQATGKGVALGHMIELCNELRADPWFCMPHKADAAYITSFATMVRDGDPANGIPPLHANAKIYVEWSNEVWNSRFPVYDWIRKGAIPGPNNDVELGAPEFFDMWANNTADDYSLWHQVFTGNEDRIIRVLASIKDSDNAWVAGKMTDRLKVLSFDRQFDAISTSAYFSDKGYTGSTSDGVALINYAMSDTNPVGTIKKSEARYIEHGALAQQLSVEMGRIIDYLAYEAGQHMTPKDQNNNLKPYSQAIIDAQALPEMYEAYFKNMQAFKDAGGSLYVAFNYINKQVDLDGGWGHLNHQDQPIADAHKLRAVLDFPNHE